MDLGNLGQAVCQIAFDAGQNVLNYYNNRIHTAQNAMIKDDGSPVTQADMASNQIIAKGLAALSPSFPIVSEEDTIPEINGGDTFWLVDPLDGTKQYIARTGEFTVNIALVKDFYPILGVIYVPTQDRIYLGFERFARTGRGAQADEAITCRDYPPMGIDVVYSRSEKNAAALPFKMPGPIASKHYVASSLKFCLIAQGRFDVYIRNQQTAEWDTGAGQAIVEAAGGAVLGSDNCRLRYQKPHWINGSFMVTGHV